METKRLMGNYMYGEIERSFHIKFSMKAAYTSFTDTEILQWKIKESLKNKQ